MKSTGPVTIVIADDHPMFRQGLRDTITRKTSFSVVGEAEDGQEALDMIRRLRPTIAILDIEMPAMTGLDVAQSVSEENLPVHVIMLTMYDEQGLFNKAIDTGVKGYILKESAVRDILNGITSIVNGEYYFSPTLSNHLLKRYGNAAHHPAASGEGSELTPTELEVLRLMAESLSSREIADRMHVSVRTIESHRHHIARKLGLSGSYALLRYALANRETLSIRSSTTWREGPTGSG
ncbi:MAG: response regulator transcription factor [Bacteroidetes bacterium]|nr:response regulator transcription factor [Bacteroidota bacterium]